MDVAVVYTYLSKCPSQGLCCSSTDFFLLQLQIIKQNRIIVYCLIFVNSVYYLLLPCIYVIYGECISLSGMKITCFEVELRNLNNEEVVLMVH